ncbi:hypothetical protein MBLNU459_g7200t1 [Dothideomycetes sp. NU459]
MARQVLKAEKSNSRKFADPRNPPPPFILAPPVLDPFLDTLDRDYVYITHIDRFPAAFKKRIFTVPVLLNVTITVLLAWRIYAAVPTYVALARHMIGYDSSAAIDTATRTTSALLWIVAKRSAMFMLDFLLLRFIGPWPISFFLEGPANPVLWRRRVGFRAAEIAVRQSRGWGADDLLDGVKVGQDSPFFATRVLPAIDRRFMRAKTAYLMMDRNWDLDFAAMISAHHLVDVQKTAALGDFEKSVLAFSAPHGRWLVWQVWKLDEEGAEEESRKKIVQLKDRLTAMGKESLFFRWIEIVQYESSGEGEFTPEKQRRALALVEKAFDEQGVDFRELVESVGGMEGMPGMDNKANVVTGD